MSDHPANSTPGVRDQRLYLAVFVIALLAIANGYQYYRNKALEADFRAASQNAKQLLKTVGQLDSALKRPQNAEANRN